MTTVWKTHRLGRKRNCVFAILALGVVSVVAFLSFSAVVFIRHLPTPQEYREGWLLWNALHEQFQGETIYEDGHERGRIGVVVYGVLSEDQQNAICQWAIEQKGTLGLASKVRMEFFDKEVWKEYPSDRNGVSGKSRKCTEEKLLRVIEF